MPGAYSFIPTLQAPATHGADSRAFYDYAAPLSLATNVQQLNGNPQANGHRHNDPAAAAYAMNQFSRDQLIQRSSIPFVRNSTKKKKTIFF